MFGQGPGAGSGEGAKSMSKSTSNAFVKINKITKASAFSSPESFLQSAFDLRGSNPSPNEHRLDMQLTLSVLEWIPLSVNLCWCYLMLIFLCSLTREAQAAYLIPFRRGAFSKTSSAAPARHLPKTLQYSSIYFHYFFNAHLQYALIVLEFGGATFRRASWTSSTFSVTRQPLAWTVLRGLAILGPACKRPFGRDQGQSDLSGVEAGHWSVRRWRGKDQIFHINSPSPLVTTSSSTSHISCFCPNTVWGENGRSKSSLPLEDQVE